MSDELEKVVEPEEVVEPEKKEKMKKKLNIKKPDLKKISLDETKKFVKSRTFFMIVAAVLLLFIVFFPHTKSTRVNAELTGVFAVQKERYVLHTMVEFSTDYVCIPGQVTKSNTVNYKLNGDVKSVEVVNCDGTYGIIKYNSNGTQRYFETTAFVGADIQTTIREYSSKGLQEKQTVTLSGVTTITTFSYDDNNEMTKKASETTTYGVVTSVGEITYKDGNVDTIAYEDKDAEITADVTCTAAGVCTLNTLNAPKFDVEWDDNTSTYELDVDGESSTVAITFPAITEFNIDVVVANIDAQAQAILDAQ